IGNSVFFGYSHQLQLLVPLYPPEYLKEDLKITFKAHVEWLGCSKICVPGNAYFSLSLLASSRGSLPNKRVAQLFKKAREHVSSDAKEMHPDLNAPQIVIPDVTPKNEAHIETLEKGVWYRRLLSSVSEFAHSDFFKIM